MKVIIHDEVPYRVSIEHGNIKLRINGGSQGELVLSSETGDSVRMQLLKSNGRNQTVDLSHIFIMNPKDKITERSSE